MNGAGNASGRTISFTTNGPATIKILASSTSIFSRTINVAKSSYGGASAGTITVTGTASVQSISLSSAGTYYVYSTNSGIYVYDIIVSEQVTGTNTNTGSNTSSSSSSSSSSSNNSSTSTASLVDGGVYVIKNVNSGKVLDVANGLNVNGANVQQWSLNGYDAQHWKIVSKGNGYYVLYAVCTSNTKVLDVPCGNTTVASNMQLWEANGDDAQVFYLKANTDGSYAILPKLNTSMCVGVAESAKTDGANVALYSYTGAASQNWTFEKVG